MYLTLALTRSILDHMKNIMSSLFTIAGAGEMQTTCGVVRGSGIKISESICGGHSNDQPVIVVVQLFLQLLGDPNSPRRFRPFPPPPLPPGPAKGRDGSPDFQAKHPPERKRTVEEHGEPSSTSALSPSASQSKRQHDTNVSNDPDPADHTMPKQTRRSTAQGLTDDKEDVQVIKVSPCTKVLRIRIDPAN